MAAKKSATAAMPPKEREHLEESVATIKSFLDLWGQFYWGFRKAFLGEPITVQVEDQFLKLKSEVARRHQYLYDQIEGIYVGGEHITDLLRKIVTLEKISKTQKENYYKVEKHWHTIFVNLHDTMMTIQYRLDQEDKQS